MSEIGVLADAARDWFSLGLAAGFLISVGFAGLLLYQKEMDLGWIGLIFLLIMIFFLIAFSFLVAASTPGYPIKIAVAVVDAFVLIGGKLLGPPFLDYLADDGTNIPLSKRGPKIGGSATRRNSREKPKIGS